jgi:hypothetical protein
MCVRWMVTVSKYCCGQNTADDKISTLTKYRCRYFVNADILSTSIFCRRQYFETSICCRRQYFVAADIFSSPIFCQCRIYCTVPWRLLFRGAYCSVAPPIPWRLLFRGTYCSKAPLTKYRCRQSLCLGKSPPEGYPSHPPPHRVEKTAEFTRGKNAIPGRGRGIRTRIWDTEKGGGGGK